METEQKSLLDTFIDEVKDDTTVNEFTLKEVQMKLPAIKHKWVGRLIRKKSDLHKLQKEKEKIKGQLVKQLQKEAPVGLSNPTAEKAVESHNSLVELSEKIYEHQLIIEFLEKVEKIFHSMTWDCKNLIDIVRLETL